MTFSNSISNPLEYSTLLKSLAAKQRRKVLLDVDALSRVHRHELADQIFRLQGALARRKQ